MKPEQFTKAKEILDKVQELESHLLDVEKINPLRINGFFPRYDNEARSSTLLRNEYLIIPISKQIEMYKDSIKQEILKLEKQFNDLE